MGGFSVPSLVDLSAVVRRRAGKCWLSHFLLLACLRTGLMPVEGLKPPFVFLCLLSGDWLVWIKQFVAGLLTGMIKCAVFTFSPGTVNSNLMIFLCFAAEVCSFLCGMNFQILIYLSSLLSFLCLLLLDGRRWIDAINTTLSGIRRADGAGIYIEYLLTVFMSLFWCLL